MSTELFPDSRVVYLDYDGCLHLGAVYNTPKRGIHLRGYPDLSLFCWAQHLIDLHEPHPDVRLVLWTSWVRTLSFRRAKARLPAALQEHVVSATWHSEMRGDWDWNELTRYQQIRRSVERHKLTRWFAIDDDTYRRPRAERERIVICDEKRGVSDPAVQDELCRKLASF